MLIKQFIAKEDYLIPLILVGIEVILKSMLNKREFITNYQKDDRKLMI